ncbi:MAG: hypothetical protein K0R57_2459 [Paenibacillaceae bacterium]|nr:hypothetical protein [Paenibacillaceae bacterium]
MENMRGTAAPQTLEHAEWDMGHDRDVDVEHGTMSIGTEHQTLNKGQTPWTIAPGGPNNALRLLGYDQLHIIHIHNGCLNTVADKTNPVRLAEFGGDQAQIGKLLNGLAFHMQADGISGSSGPQQVHKLQPEPTRAEYAHTIVQLLTGKQGNGSYTANDIGGHWAAASIMRVLETGAMRGYGDGTITLFECI